MAVNFKFVEYMAGLAQIPSRCTIPRYAVRTLDRSLSTLDIGIGEVKQLLTIDEIPQPSFLKFDIKRFVPSNILGKIMEKIKLPFDVPKDELVAMVAEAEPSDGSEIGDWMHLAVSESVLNGFIAENYNQSNRSYMEVTSADAYTPGVRLGGIKFISEASRKVRNRGYSRVRLPDKSEVTVPSYGGVTIIRKNLLAWAHDDARKGKKQHTGKLMKWSRLAETIEGTVRNLVCQDYGGENGINPQFFAQNFRRAVRAIRVRARFWSKTDQRVKIRWRDPRDYSRVVYEDFIDAPNGQSELTVTFGATPNTPPLVAEVQPTRNNFTIESYSVSEVS